MKILKVQRVPGNQVRPHWRNPADIVTTDDGVFVADPDHGFDRYIGSTPSAYYDTHEGIDYIWMNHPGEG